MSQLLHLTGSLVTVGIALAQFPEAFATDSEPSGYQLMNESEIAAHTATMQVLQGTAREEYRDAQYERLKQRALDHGFLMPDIPPWRSQSTAAVDAGQAGASSAPPSPDAAVTAAERHAEMRNKLEARRAATPPASGADSERTQAKTSASAQPQAASVQIGAVSNESPQPTGQVATAGETDDNIPQVATAGVQQDSPINDNTADRATGSADVSAAVSSNDRPDARSGNAATEPTDSRPAQVEASTTVQAPTPPTPPPPPAPPPAYQPGPVPGVGTQTVTGSGAEPPAAAAANASAEAMKAYRDSMRARFDEYMKERQAQLDANMQRQQQQAAQERKRFEAPRYPIQPYPYPAMPAYGPRYPAAFPGYREPYWQQR